MNFKIDPKCGQKIGSIFEVSFWKRTVTCVTFLSVQILLSKSTNWTKIKEPRHGSSLFKKDQMLKSFPNDLKVQRVNMSGPNHAILLTYWYQFDGITFDPLKWDCFLSFYVLLCQLPVSHKAHTDSCTHVRM